MSTTATTITAMDPSSPGAIRGSGPRSPLQDTTRSLRLGHGAVNAKELFVLAISVVFILLVALHFILVPLCSRRGRVVAEEGSEDANASRERREQVSSHIVSKAVEPHDDSRCGPQVEGGSSETDLSSDSSSQGTVEDPADDRSDASAAAGSSSSSSPRHTCHICLERLRVGDVAAWSRSGACRHAFHRDCIAEWLERQDGCPCCRAPWVESSKEGAMKDDGDGNSGGDAASSTDKGSQSDLEGDAGEDEESGMSAESANERSFCVVHGIVPGRGGLQDQLKGPPHCVSLPGQQADAVKSDQG